MSADIRLALKSDGSRLRGAVRFVANPEVRTHAQTDGESLSKAARSG
jgi:hypothetical protein